MADRGVDLAALPKEVKDHLAELELELSEGKKRDGSYHLTFAMFSVSLLIKSHGVVAL